MGLRDWLGHIRLSRRKDGDPSSSNVPYHIAIIMDGNGRWASRRALPVLAGHRAGTKALKKTIRAAIELGVSQLTVYSFSTENWNRPEDEVSGLMALLEEMIEAEVPELKEQGVRLVFVGRLEAASAALQERMRWGERETAANERLTLFVAFNYGGRAEILDAFRAATTTGLDPLDLSEDDLARHLYSPEMRDPDLIIRTSGELRLSNFLLWQSAYAEMYFTECLWPDFDEDELRRAVGEYARRRRRFGRREPVGA
jgi:undecaprenyl diphosphate synthase